ncbi:MAG TPA: anti-sigma factor [Porphyromonadaceae bacterium]|jgi:ferric-dicitrate binding protein FerR (iron transport regulator)|nr:anti-sigma factor [Porphyromonadaceae bacterium]
MIDKTVLYKFFEGSASREEEMLIQAWLDDDTRNIEILHHERFLYDSILLNRVEEKTLLRPQKRQLLPWAITAAAMLALLIVCGFYVNSILHHNQLSAQYNTIIVPPGQRINLVLADSTNLWLNANTTFRYPSGFSGKERVVYLDGEGYFDVSKDTKKPFIVKTSAGDIKVTGTAFNVEAYSKFGSFETALFEGSVDIYRENQKLTSLRAKEKSTLYDNKLYVSPIINTDKYLWKDGFIAFEKKKLEDILISLEKYFDIKIQVNMCKLPQHSYTGKFRQSDGVDYALRVLQKSIHFNYYRDDEKNIIYIQ